MRKPAPFKRNSIDVGRHNRIWKHVLASELKKNDVVSGRGLVTVVSLNDDHSETLRVGYLSGEMDTFYPEEQIFAFVERGYNG